MTAAVKLTYTTSLKLQNVADVQNNTAKKSDNRFAGIGGSFNPELIELLAFAQNFHLPDIL